MKAPETLKADLDLRKGLLTFFLETLTGPELADWLRDIDRDTRGTLEEKQQRIRDNTQYLSMPATEFPAQTELYLKPYSSEFLADLCEELGISVDGSKDQRYRRIMREVHRREGWLARLGSPQDVSTLSPATIAPILGWYPISKDGRYEKDFYPAIYDELRETFGDVVYQQLPVAHGSILKIDFHVGDPQGHGVGVEVKMPTSNADVQRALGQLDQYQQRYGDNLLILIIDGLKPEVLTFFLEALKRKSIATVVR
jgi:hypothetical protein